MKPLCIIGTGCAGYRLAQAVRRLDAQRQIHLFTVDDGAYYAKPTLSNAWRTGKTPETLLLNTAEQMQQQWQVTVHTHTPIKAIHRDSMTLETEAGAVFEYADCVLATGASPRNDCLPSAVMQHCLPVNNLTDYRTLRAHCNQARRVAIIGAGLVGCEMANDLLAAGFEVHLVAATQQPLTPLLPTAAATVMQRAFEASDVSCHWGQTVTSVQKDAEQYAVNTSAGETILADVVLSAVGLQSNIGLAKSAGLTVRHGVVVNHLGQTEDPHIYALGDVAEFAGQVRFYIAPITASINSMASTLTGQPQSIVLPAMAVNIKTSLCPTVVCAPPPHQVGQWHVAQAGPDLVALYRAGDVLHGFVLMNQAVQQRAQWLPQVQQASTTAVA